MILESQSAVSIVCEKGAHPAIIYAREQLALYLKKTIGVNATFTDKKQENAISFLLKTVYKCDQIVHDGFSVTIRRNLVEIYSLEPRGVLYGVYDFLERYCSIRFLAPHCEICPRQQNLQIKDETYCSNPAFPLRGAYNAATRFDKDYYAKLRNHNQFEVPDEKYGGYCGWERVNGLTGHTTLQYIPIEKYFQEHPELYAIHDGKPTDICFTSGITEEGKPEARTVTCARLISDYIKRRIREDKTLRYFMIGQTDSWEGFDNECYCDRCVEARKKYGSSGVLIRFLNVVAEEVEKYIEQNEKGREVWIVGFSYSQTYLPPVLWKDGSYEPIDETVIPRNNVIIWLCETDKRINKFYAFDDKEHNTESAQVYEAWKSLTNRIMLWEYGVNFSEYNWYFPSLRSMASAIRTVAKEKCEYALVLLSYTDQGEWQSLLKGYILSKLMWDPSLNEQELLYEFTEGYYGKGGRYVRNVIEIFEKHFERICETDKTFRLYMTKSDDYVFNPNYYPIELLDEAENILKRGIEELKSTKGYETEISRMKGVLLTPMRMKLYNYLYYDRNIERMADYYETFAEICRESGITCIGESGGMEELDWQIRMLKECAKHPISAWDLYRYLYDGIVNHYTLPERVAKISFEGEPDIEKDSVER